MYVEYRTNLDLRFVEETLNDHLCDTLKELKV